MYKRKRNYDHRARFRRMLEKARKPQKSRSEEMVKAVNREERHLFFL